MPVRIARSSGRNSSTGPGRVEKKRRGNVFDCWKRYLGLYPVSHKENRIEVDLSAVVKQLTYNLYAWSIADGLVNTATGQSQDAMVPLEAITAIATLPENTLVLLRDFHLHLEDNNPVLPRAIQEALLVAKTQGKVIIILASRHHRTTERAARCGLNDRTSPWRKGVCGGRAGGERPIILLYLCCQLHSGTFSPKV